MSELLGTRALARELGVSPAAVTKAVREKRLTPTETTNGRAMFDPEVVRRQWTPPVASPPKPAADAAENATDVERYNKARADKEESLAAQEMLKLEQLRGNLLAREEISLSFTQFLRVANQAFSGLPVKTLSRHPGLTPEGRNFLMDEIRIILDGLAKWEPGA